MTRKPRVLFITAPNTSLFYKKRFVDMSMGASFVAGGLEQAGFQVDHYDFNMMLNRFREESLFSTDDLKLLSSNEHLLAFLQETHGGGGKVFSWASKLCDCIDLSSYDFIGISLDRVTYDSFVSKGSLFFALILAKELRRRKNLPTFVGGRETLRVFGREALLQLQKELGDLDPFDLYFLKNAHDTFPEVLKLLWDGAEKDSPLVKELVEKKSLFSKMKNILPKYDLVNVEDQWIKKEQIFPQFILNKYEKLKELQPIFLAPYKFSLGCPFRCSFCDDGMVDFHSHLGVDNIVNNLYQLQKKGYKHFRFFNNNINMGLKFINSFHEKAIESGLNIKYSDSANFRILNPEIMQKIVDTGCIKLWYGSETTSERMQGIINKKVSMKRITSHLESANKLNVWNGLNFIFNFPHETAEDFETLLEFMQRRDLVDTFYANQFMLMDQAEYAVRPEKFAIKIRDVSDNGLIASYDEIEGLRWEEKKALGQQKADLINQAIAFPVNFIKSSDHLIFSLREIYDDKEQMKQVINDMVAYLEAQGQLVDYAFQVIWRLPNKVYDVALPQSNIQHHELSAKGNHFSKSVGFS